MRAIRAVERFHTLLGVLSGLSILAITLIIAADVALRVMFNSPVRGATELSTLLMVGLVYLGLAAVQSSKANFRVELLIVRLPRRARQALELFTTVLSAIAIAFLAWHTGQEAWQATLKQEMSFGAIVFPVWPARIVIAFGLTMLLVQLLIDILRLCLGAPITETAHEAAEAGRPVQ